jgi:hypothetical protein
MHVKYMYACKIHVCRYFFNIVEQIATYVVSKWSLGIESHKNK